MKSDSVSRRQFLQTTTAATAALTLGNLAMPARADDSASERPHSNRGRIYKSNKGGGVGRNYDEMVATLNQYRELGFDGIESVSPGISDIDALKRAVADTGVPVHGVVDNVHWGDDHRLSSPDPAARERGVAALEQAIRDCHAIGGSAVLLVPGKVTGPDETHDDVWKRSIVEIRKALPTASRYGVPVLIENVWNGFCEDPQQAADYIDEIDSPWVGQYFDIGNCRKFGPAEDWIRTLGSRITKMDVKDWGQANGFCRLGEGDVNWPAVREALAEINYTGWATREGRDNSLEDTAALIDELLDL